MAPGRGRAGLGHGIAVGIPGIPGGNPIISPQCDVGLDRELEEGDLASLLPSGIEPDVSLSDGGCSLSRLSRARRF